MTLASRGMLAVKIKSWLDVLIHYDFSSFQSLEEN